MATQEARDDRLPGDLPESGYDRLRENEQAQTLKQGVYCLPGQTSVIMLAPPLAVTEKEIDFAMEVFDRTLPIADAEVSD